LHKVETCFYKPGVTNQDIDGIHTFGDPVFSLSWINITAQDRNSQSIGLQQHHYPILNAMRSSLRNIDQHFSPLLLFNLTEIFQPVLIRWKKMAPALLVYPSLPRSLKR